MMLITYMGHVTLVKISLVSGFDPHKHRRKMLHGGAHQS